MAVFIVANGDLQLNANGMIGFDFQFQWQQFVTPPPHPG